MKIPKYVDELLGYNTKNGRKQMIEQITDYSKYPDCIPGYLYRINIVKYKYPRCFQENIEKFVKWCNKQHADARMHKVVIDGWNTYAIVSISDPVALAFEKLGFIDTRFNS